MQSIMIASIVYEQTLVPLALKVAEFPELNRHKIAHSTVY